MSHHDASPCRQHSSGATRHSSGQRHTPSDSHSMSVSSVGGAHPLLTSNHAWALRTPSTAEGFMPAPGMFGELQCSGSRSHRARLHRASDRGQRRAHPVAVVRVAVADAHDDGRCAHHPLRASIGPGFRDPTARTFGHELVAPRGDRERSDVHVEGETAPRIGERHGARGRPPPPALLVVAPETGTHRRPRRTAEPATRRRFRTPLAHPRDVAHETVERERRCRDRLVDDHLCHASHAPLSRRSGSPPAYVRDIRSARRHVIDTARSPSKLSIGSVPARTDSLIDATAGCRTMARMRLTTSRIRILSLSPPSMRKSTCGSSRGSAERKLSTPREHTRMAAPISPPPDNDSSVVPVALKQMICMSFGPASAKPDVYRITEVSTGRSTDNERPRSLSATSKPAVAAWSIRIDPTGSPRLAPTPQINRIAGDCTAPAHRIMSWHGMVSLATVMAKTAVRPSKSTRSTRTSPRTTRWRRALAGSRYASLVDTRRPSRRISAHGLSPVAPRAW